MQATWNLSPYSDRDRFHLRFEAPESQPKARRLITSLGDLVSAVQDRVQPYNEQKVTQITLQILRQYATNLIVADDVNSEDSFEAPSGGDHSFG